MIEQLTDELVLQRETNDRNNHLLHISQDLLVRVYRGHDLTHAFSRHCQRQRPEQDQLTVPIVLATPIAP